MLGANSFSGIRTKKNEFLFWPKNRSVSNFLKEPKFFFQADFWFDHVSAPHFSLNVIFATNISLSCSLLFSLSSPLSLSRLSSLSLGPPTHWSSLSLSPHSLHVLSLTLFQPSASLELPVVGSTTCLQPPSLPPSVVGEESNFPPDQNPRGVRQQRINVFWNSICAENLSIRFFVLSVQYSSSKDFFDHREVSLRCCEAFNWLLHKNELQLHLQFKFAIFGAPKKFGEFLALAWTQALILFFKQFCRVGVCKSHTIA